MARDRSIPALVALALGVLAAHTVLGLTIGEGYAIPTTIIGAAAVAFVLRGPVGQALARRLHSEPSAELPPEQVLTELEDLRGRLMELEERVDFSERLLAQKREREGQAG